MPFTIKDVVGAELDLPEADELSHSQRAASIVPVAKVNGHYHIDPLPLEGVAN